MTFLKKYSKPFWKRAFLLIIRVKTKVRYGPFVNVGIGIGIGIGTDILQMSLFRVPQSLWTPNLAGW